MNSLCVKTLLWLLLFTIVVVQLVQGALQCLRTNRKPNTSCGDECQVGNGCSHRRKRCICDRDCGYSCVNPNRKCEKPTVRNGRVIFNSFRFNATQRTICNPGFKLSGSVTRTCRGNGFWDGKRSRCRKLKNLCRDPGTPGLLMRYTYPSVPGFKPGRKLLYYCPPKFIMVGSRTLVCKQNGNWSTLLPVCREPKCNEVVLPPNSYVIRPKNWKNLRAYGVRLTLGCNPGYALGAKRGEQVCVTPGWKLEPSSFKCFPKSCPDPGLPRNGQRKGLFVFGEKVYFTCDQCYKLKGPSYRQCQANQRWSDSQPTCERVVCPSLRNPANGRMTVTSYRCGGSVNYQCNNNYQLDGPSKRTCQSDGTWSGKESTCRVKGCPDPAQPRNGQRKGQFLFGEKVYFTCDQCYKLKGPSYRQCQANQRWSDSQPTCERVVCPSLRNPANSRMSVTSYRCGGSVNYQCSNNYQLDGPRKRTCQSDGTWSGKESTCRATSCPDPGQPRNGQRKGQFQFGEKVYFTCDQCYKLKGPSYRQCQANQRWSHSQPTCERIVCPALRSPINGRMIVRSYGCGSSVEYQCYYGYQMDGPRVRTCQSDGTWSGKESTCRAKSCPDPGQPRNGQRKGQFLFGEKVYFTCDQCYKLKGPSYRQCQANQRWSDSQPTCERVVCPSLRRPANGRMTVTSYLCGDSVNYQCSNNYQLDGPRKRTCQSDGAWSGKESSCHIAKRRSATERSTWPPLIGKQAKITTAPLFRKQTKSPTSKQTTPTTKGRTASVSTTVKMISTTVKLKSPCGSPNLSPEAKIRLVGRQSLLIGCQKQYSLLSSGIMRCIKKSWRTVKKVSCLLRGCPFPGVPENGFKDGLSYLHNDVIKFSCDKCYTLMGHSERICLKNGTWSHSQPKCVLKTCLPLKNTRKATVSNDSLNCGAIARYECKTKYEVMLGSGERTCGGNGAWTGDEPKCVDRNFNIALMKSAIQSSEYKYSWPGPADRAVDGNRNPKYFRRSSCTHTQFQHGAWWRVDLLKEEPVAMVIVVNRQNCCHYRLNNFKVSVGNDKDGRKNSICGGMAKPGSGQVMEIQCPGLLTGRYVSVYLPRRSWSVLTLCEVEVYRRLQF